MNSFVSGMISSDMNHFLKLCTKRDSTVSGLIQPKIHESQLKMSTIILSLNFPATVGFVVQELGIALATWTWKEHRYLTGSCSCTKQHDTITYRTIFILRCNSEKIQLQTVIGTVTFWLCLNNITFSLKSAILYSRSIVS